MRRTAAALALIGVVALGGCESNRRLGLFPPNSRLIGQSTLDRIKPGETTAEWVDAVLGQPTDIEDLSLGREIWKYRYQVVSGGSYRLHARSDKGGTVRTIYIEMADNVVTDKWMD